MASLGTQTHGGVQMVASVLTAVRTGKLKGCHGHEPSLKLKKTS